MCSYSSWSIRVLTFCVVNEGRGKRQVNDRLRHRVSDFFSWWEIVLQMPSLFSSLPRQASKFTNVIEVCLVWHSCLAFNCLHKEIHSLISTKNVSLHNGPSRRVGFEAIVILLQNLMKQLLFLNSPMCTNVPLVSSPFLWWLGMRNGRYKLWSCSSYLFLSLLLYFFPLRSKYSP
jgi:hypothetical protein